MPDVGSHILVPTNLSARTWSTWQYALRLSMELRSQLTFLHVAPARPPWARKFGLDALEYLHDVMRSPAHADSWIPSNGHAPANSDASHTCAERSITEHLHSSIHPEVRDFLKLQTVIRQGNVAEEIISFARDQEVDTIVMSSRPRSGWRRWTPSITEQVMRQAACRIVLVPHPAVPATV